MTTASSNLPGIELAPHVWTDRAELRFGFSRSSGPGGQNVNKVNTKTELRIRLTSMHGLSERAMSRFAALVHNRITADGDLVITADNQRTQEANRQACLKKLRVLIEAAQVEPKVRKKTKVSRGAKLRRLESKKVNGAKKKLRARVE
jgi:ribosome-associated protein